MINVVSVKYKVTLYYKYEKPVYLTGQETDPLIKGKLLKKVDVSGTYNVLKTLKSITTKFWKLNWIIQINNISSWNRIKYYHTYKSYANLIQVCIHILICILKDGNYNACTCYGNYY